VDDFVTEKENVVDTGHMSDIMTELYSQECFSNPSTGTVSLWISDATLSDYEWQSKKLGTIRKSAVSMDKFKSINRLMSTLNEEHGANYNSCLVQFYKDGNSGVRLHEDLEPTMDSSHPIGVVSLGADRRVDFFSPFCTFVSTGRDREGVKSVCSG
jgi:alkylated DNA repair dioxygenase AlkB